MDAYLANECCCLHSFIVDYTWVWWSTVLVLKPEYPGMTRSIPWLMMHWFHVSPCHPQLWYWPCRRQKEPLFSTMKDFQYLHYLSVETESEVKIYFIFPKNDFNMRKVKPGATSISIQNSILHPFQFVEMKCESFGFSLDTVLATVLDILILLTHLPMPWTKWPQSCRRYFQIYFICSYGFNCQ